jgi:hypothetical protein
MFQPLHTLKAETLYIFLPGYSAPAEGERFSDAGLLLNAFANRLARRRSQALRGHVRIHRDYYANPRSPAYMINAVGKLISQSTIGRAIMVVGNNVAISYSDVPWADQFKVVPCPLAQSTWAQVDIVAGPEDTALLLHSDAVGLGMTVFEKRLLAVGFGQVAILNGRRRCYSLDPALHGLLGRHRFHSEVRIVESILAGVARCAGFAFSVRDRLSRKELR